jgi:DNA-binding CsgD family transcriptional regulator
MARDQDAIARKLAAGRAALASGSWELARDRLLAVVTERESAETWEALGWAGWWLADEELTLRARRRAYRLFRASDDAAGAGRVATWLAADHREFRGEEAIGRGWLERAHRLLDPLPESPDQGWLALTDADFALNVDRDLEAVVRLAGSATRLGRRHRVADLEAVGLALEGLALVCGGDVAEGMRRLDESSALASAEEMRLPLSSGWALCCVLSACEGIGDFARAEQWCEAIRRFTARWGGRQLLGVCRTSYGRILALNGNWRAAEAELLGAVEDMERARPGMAAAGLARLGELRARQGRKEEAHALFARAGVAGRLGLGELALAAGDARAAGDAAERVLRRTPATARLDRVPALELLARARMRLGDLVGAERCAVELDAAADAFGTAFFAGRSKLLRAELAAARGEHDDARRAAEDAVDSLEEASALYEAARARVELARALLAVGRDTQGRAEALAAQETFEALGAEPDAAGTSELLRDDTGGGDLTPRELEILKLVARGMNDAQIAERLFVSPHTVHRHVANIRVKLRLSSRSAAVAYATRAGLI